MTPWTVAYQAPPSMGFSRKEYWSGVPLPSLRLQVRAWENIFHENGKQKKAGVAIFISDKIDLKIKKITEIRKDTT